MAADDMGRERDLTRVRKKVEALRVWQLSEVLNLDEVTSSKLFPAMREADEERWKIESRNREMMKEMTRILRKTDPDSQKLNPIFDELQANRRAMIRAEERHLERVRQVLSPEDTARYLIFQIKFQREIKRKAVQAYQERKGLSDSDGSPERDSSGSGGSGGSGSGGSNGSGGSGGSGRR
jgi:uncharacterized membrane protein YgcG